LCKPLARRAQYASEARARQEDASLGADGFHPLAGIALQRQLEATAYVLGGSSYEAPGQLVGDFLAKRPSTTLGSVQPSYKPGVKLGDLGPSLPALCD
jgi:uncharacterized FAD-dependent dehydrogenase